jgi:hypothetical protein
MKWVAIGLAGIIGLGFLCVFGLVLLVSMFFGFGSGLPNGRSAVALGPPVNLGVVKPPTLIVQIDESVAADYPPLLPCHVSASILLAQQQVESGYQATVTSSAGAQGLSQFEPGTFAEYDRPIPPGGADPPSPDNPQDAAWAEARYLCSLGIDINPFNALVAYNCGNTSTACVAASSGYAQEILALAKRISIPPSTKKIITAIGVGS